MFLSRLLASMFLLALSVTPLLAQPAEPLPAGAVARLGSAKFRHPAMVRFVGYSGDGATLITLSGDGDLRFWDARTGKETHRLELKVNSQRIEGGSIPIISGDGKTLVLGADDKDCTIIDITTAKIRKEFTVNHQPRSRFGGVGNPSPQLSHDGKLLVVIDGGESHPDGNFSVFDTSTGKLVHKHLPKMKGESCVAATFSRDGTTLIRLESPNREGKGGKDDKGDSKPHFRFVEAATGKEIRSVASSAPTGADFTLAVDGRYLFANDRNSQGRDPNGLAIYQIDALTGKEVRKFGGKLGMIRGSSLSPDHKSLFVACAKQITQYDLTTGNVLREIPIGGRSRDDGDDFGPFSRTNHFVAALSPDSKTLAVPAYTSITFWDVATAKETPVDQGHRHRIDSIAFGPQGKVLTGAADGALYLWDAATGSRTRHFERKIPMMDEERPRRGGPERVDLFKVRGAFAPDGKTIAGLWWGEKLHIWDTTNGKLVHELGWQQGHTSFSYSPDGRSIALAGVDGSVSLWHAEAGREAKILAGKRKVDPMEPPGDPEFDQFGRGAYSTSFSPDGRTLICSGMEMEPLGLTVNIRHWEVASGQERKQLNSRMTFNDGGAISFDAITAALDSFVARFVFAADGATVLEAGFANVKLRNVRTGAEIRSFGGKQVAGNTVLFSPDGKMLVAGKHDGAIRVWDLATGSVLIDFPAHPAHVTALAFSADGKWLASGARDSSLLIWNWEHIRNQALAQQPATPDAKAEALWNDLADKDAAKAYSAIKALVQTPAQSVPLLKAKLKPIPQVDPKHIKKLLDDLDHPQYPIRQKADEALERLGDLAAPAIKGRRASGPSVETARRLEALQKKLDAQVLPQDVLQALRAIETLELIGSPDARNVLDGLAKGAAGHRITEDARDSVRRLTPKKAP